MLSKINRSNRKAIIHILSLALPAMMESIFQAVVGFADTLFVSKLGLIEVSAVGMANNILAVYIAVFMSVGIGTSSLIARSVGAKNINDAKIIARQSTVLSLSIGVFLGLITLFFAKPLLRVMGAEPQVLQESVTYFRIVGIPSIFISLMFIFGSILRASGDTKTPMKVSFWVNIINIGLDYILILGIGKFPGLGVIGAALATVMVRIYGTIALYYYIKKSPISFSLSSKMLFDNKQYTFSILKLSTPATIERLIMRLGQVLYLGLIVHMGTATYAAHTIAGNIETFCYMPGYGLAVAATTLVGQHLGGNRIKTANMYGILTTIISVIIMSFIGIFLFILAPWMASWFTREGTVISMVVTALRIDAFAQPALAMVLVLTGALQGIGDTKSPMYSTAIGIWFIRIIGVYILGIKLNMGIAGIWLSIAIDLCIRAIYLSFRFNKKITSHNMLTNNTKPEKIIAPTT